MSSLHCLMIRVFQCEDTLTGIMTGVYDAWDSRIGHKNVRLETAYNKNMELFCEYVRTEPDIEKAEKVIRTVKSRLGEEAFDMIAYAAACDHDGKADAIYRMIVLGLHLPDGSLIGNMLTQPDVRLVFELRRRVWHMAHQYTGFVRFRELENGVLLSEIDAEADILSLIAPHFADRLPLENWIIYDRHREKAAVHSRGRGYFLLEEVDKESLLKLRDSGEEAGFETLWKSFHKVIAVEARVNGGLQMSMLPKKFRAFMNEFFETKTFPEGKNL